MVLAAIALGAMPQPAAACLALLGREWRTDIVLTGLAVKQQPGGLLGRVAEFLGGESPTIGFEIRIDSVEKGPPWLRRAPTVTVQFDSLTSCQHRLELGQRYRLGANESLFGLTVPFGSVEVLPQLPGTPDAEHGELPDAGWIALVSLIAMVLVVGGSKLARRRRWNLR